MPQPTRLTRRQTLALLAATGAGMGVAWALRSTADIGQDVGDNATARAVLADNVSPIRTVDAPTLTAAVFTDYQCPACKLADPEFEAAFVKDGRVRLVYRDWPIFGAMSERAARIAIAADRQGIYPALHRALMAERLPLTDDILRAAVERTGGDWARAERDLAQNADAIDRRLDRTREDAFALGIAGTPAYLIGRILVIGAQNQAGFARVFARARALAA